MSSNDRAADRQPQAHALRFPREHWLKNAVLNLRTDARAGILDGSQHAAALIGLRAYPYQSRPSRGGANCLYSIYHKVHYNLLQLCRVTLDEFASRRQSGLEQDFVLLKLRLHELERIADQAVDIEHDHRR